MELTAEYIQSFFRDEDSISHIGLDFMNGLCGGGIHLTHILIDGYKAGSSDVSAALDVIVREALSGSTHMIDVLQAMAKVRRQEYEDKYPICPNHAGLFRLGYEYALLNHKTHVLALVKDMHEKEEVVRVMKEWIAAKTNTDISAEDIERCRKSTYLTEESLKDIEDSKFHGLNILQDMFIPRETLVMLQKFAASKDHPLKAFLEIFQRVFDNHYATFEDITSISDAYPAADILFYFHIHYDSFVKTEGLNITKVCERLQGRNTEMHEGDFEVLVNNACREQYGEEEHRKLWQK